MAVEPADATLYDLGLSSLTKILEVFSSKIELRVCMWVYIGGRVWFRVGIGDVILLGGVQLEVGQECSFWEFNCLEAERDVREDDLRPVVERASELLQDSRIVG